MDRLKSTKNRQTAVADRLAVVNKTHFTDPHYSILANNSKQRNMVDEADLYERQPESDVQREMTMMRRSTSSRTRYRTTAWWKYEDRSNRNCPKVLETEKGRQVIRAPGQVVDNFRFADADRKWVQDEPQYVERNLTRLVRSCRRAKSLDEDSDNDDGGGLRSFDDSPNHHTSVDFNCTTSLCSDDITRTSVRCGDEQQQTGSTLKRSRSRWTSEDPLFDGRSAEERRVIDDLLSLDSDEDQSMEVDTDHEEGQPVHHEFLEISNELQHLCISNDDSMASSADPQLTVGGLCPSSSSAVDSFPRHGKIYSTARKVTHGGNHSTGSSNVRRQLLKSRSSCPYISHVTSTETNIKATERSHNENSPNSHRFTSVSTAVSNSESVYRQHLDQRRSEPDDVLNRSKVVLESVANLLPSNLPASCLSSSERPAIGHLSKYDDTSEPVSSIHHKCKSRQSRTADFAPVMSLRLIRLCSETYLLIIWLVIKKLNSKV